MRHGDGFSCFKDARVVSGRRFARSDGDTEVHAEPTPMVSVAAFGLLVVGAPMK